MSRTIFRLLSNILRPFITRQDTRFRQCLPGEVVLKTGLFCLAHGCLYVSIRPCFNIVTTTVFEAAQDVLMIRQVPRNVARNYRGE